MSYTLIKVIFVLLTLCRYLESFSGSKDDYKEVPFNVFFCTEMKKEQHHAFCSGAIITGTKVLTSANCFYTNRKRLRLELHTVGVVGGSKSIRITNETSGRERHQWRRIKNLHSQKYFRFPNYGLCIAIMNQRWVFQDNVNKIPYAKLNTDFNGVCRTTGVIIQDAYDRNKDITTELVEVVPREQCENDLQRTCRLFYCTIYDKESKLTASEIEGGAMICFGTGDPNEIDNRGVLVGITTLINKALPTLHNRVGLFNKWINDSTAKPFVLNHLIFCTVLIAHFVK